MLIKSLFHNNNVVVPSIIFQIFYAAIITFGQATAIEAGQYYCSLGQPFLVRKTLH